MAVVFTDREAVSAQTLQIEFLPKIYDITANACSELASSIEGFSERSYF